MMDETTDCGGTEQASIVIRSVDTHRIVHEHFMRVVEAADVTGAGLVNLITSTVSGLGLDLKNCRGEAYGGAAAMTGASNGCEVIARRDSPWQSPSLLLSPPEPLPIVRLQSSGVQTSIRDDCPHRKLLQPPIAHAEDGIEGELFFYNSSNSSM